MKGEHECQYCTKCRAILKAGIVKSYDNVLPEEYLFDKWGKPMYNTCADGSESRPYNSGIPRTCEGYVQSPIKASDLDIWEAFIAKRFEVYAAYKWVTLEVKRGEDTLEIKYKAGSRNALWKLKIGEPAEQFAPILRELATDAYNQARLEQLIKDPEPSPRSFHSFNLCDKDIDADGWSSFWKYCR